MTDESAARQEPVQLTVEDLRWIVSFVDWVARHDPANDDEEWQVSGGRLVVTDARDGRTVVLVLEPETRQWRLELP